ncbi:MAG TPA: SDR family NAD-dependent epimerase/dehydratase, partial [Tenuifilaceae bacterium]|nr:SDR family NAD-dependent epimerase/dehydratase [Tenuifilaceae bacterium]
LVYFPLPENDPLQRKPDISLAKKFLGGWEPKVMLEDGLKKTIDSFEHILIR